MEMSAGWLYQFNEFNKPRSSWQTNQECNSSCWLKLCLIFRRSTEIVCNHGKHLYGEKLKSRESITINNSIGDIEIVYQEFYLFIVQQIQGGEKRIYSTRKTSGSFILETKQESVVYIIEWKFITCFLYIGWERFNES